jgi:hypothetical protein
VAAARPIQPKPSATLRKPDTSTNRLIERDMRSIGARI